MTTTCTIALVMWMLLIPSGLLADSEKKVKMKDLPAAVQQAVKEQSKGATLKGLTTDVDDGQTLYEAELSVDGHGKDVSFDAFGKVVSVEEEVVLASLPAAARSAVEKAVGTGKLQKIESVNENGKSLYEAAISKDGKSSEVKIDANGTTLR
jgi:uncharacterized membrane protein YkoI